MIDINAALSYLYEDFLLNASVIDPILRGTAEVLCAFNGCVFLRERSGVLMLQTEDLGLARTLLEKTPTATLVVHDEKLVPLAVELKGYDEITPCYQAVYTGDPPSMSGSLDIRPLVGCEAGYAVEMYRFDLASAQRHIELGLIYGGFSKGEIAGIVGYHYQGSMGMLFVKPQFRRAGAGEELEKFVIRKKLAKNEIPYCQVVEGNEPSLALQRKLGLGISDKKLFWLSRRK